MVALQRDRVGVPYRVIDLDIEARRWYRQIEPDRAMPGQRHVELASEVRQAGRLQRIGQDELRLTTDGRPLRRLRLDPRPGDPPARPAPAPPPPSHIPQG